MIFPLPQISYYHVVLILVLNWFLVQYSEKPEGPRFATLVATELCYPQSYTLQMSSVCLAELNRSCPLHLASHSVGSVLTSLGGGGIVTVLVCSPARHKPTLSTWSRPDTNFCQFPPFTDIPAIIHTHAQIYWHTIHSHVNRIWNVGLLW